MEYGLRYILTWWSNRGNDCKIEVYKKGYTGEAQLKKQGGAPALLIDNADNGIMGTSLQFTIQADTDGELQELYTTDSKMYKVLLYRNDAVIWSGYLLQELYSEEYIAAPYDVSVTATDQLALLKDEPYKPLGRVSLLRIIDNALSATQLEIGYAVQSALRPEEREEDASLFEYITINDEGYINRKCYDVIAGIMSTCNAIITQQDNRWCIIRRNDVNAKVYMYTKSLSLLESLPAEAVVIGNLSENKVYPIGSLTRMMVPVPKSLNASFAPIKKLSYFDNPNMEGERHWNWNLAYITAKPGKVIGSFGSKDQTLILDSFLLKTTNRKSKEYALWQSVSVEQSSASLSLQVAYCPLLPLILDSTNTQREVILVLQVKLETDSGTYYLSRNGWQEKDLEDIKFTAEPLDDTTANRANKSNYSVSTVTFPPFPGSGVLTLSFRNDSIFRPKIESGSNDIGIFFDANIAVTNVYLTAADLQGYESNVMLNSNGNGSHELEFSFSDAYGVGNEEKNLYNFIKMGENDIFSWILAGYTYSSFYRAIIQDLANMLGQVRSNYSGVVSGEKLVAFSYLEKFSGQILRLENATIDLLADEMSGEWIQVPASAVDVEEFEIITNEDSAVTVDGESAQKTTGNYPTLESFEALSKVVNKIDSIIGLDENDDAFIKLKKIKEIDESGEEVEKETPRNFYSFGEVSSGGKGAEEDTPSEGDGLINAVYGADMLGSITEEELDKTFSAFAIDTIYKQLQELINGGVGGGLDVNAMWDELGSKDDTKVIHSSHIPNLGGKYVTLDTEQAITGVKYFNNHLRIGTAYYLLMRDRSEARNYINIAEISSNNTLLLGYGLNSREYNMDIFGNRIRFCTGSSRSEAMRITDTGNVLIGSTTDGGYKLDVKGRFRLVSPNGQWFYNQDNGNMTIRNGATSGSWAQSYVLENPNGTNQTVRYGVKGGLGETSELFAYIAVGDQSYSNAALRIFADKTTVRGNLLPFANKSYDIGSESYRWTNIYAESLIGNAETATDADMLDGYHYEDIISNILQYGRTEFKVYDSGWYRIGQWRGYGSVLLTISGTYGNVRSTAANFVINKTHTSVAISQIGKASANVMMSKVRVVQDASISALMYIELYMGGTYTVGQQFVYRFTQLVNGQNNYPVETLDCALTTEELTEMASIDILTNADVHTAAKLANRISLWGNGFDGTESLGGTIRPSETNVYNLGSTTYLWNRLYIRFIEIGDDNAGNIYFNRPTGNYIWATKQGATLSLGVYDASATASTYKSMLLIGNNYVRRGTDMNDVTLGQSSYPWANTYTSAVSSVRTITFANGQTLTIHQAEDGADTNVLYLTGNLAVEGEVSSGGVGQEEEGELIINLLKSWSDNYDENTALSAGLGIDLNNRLIALEENGVGGLDTASLWNELSAVDASKVIDASHIPDLSNIYLPKTGGLINSKTTTSYPLIMNSNLGSKVYLAIRHSGGDKAFFGWQDGFGVRFYNQAAGSSSIGIKDDATPYYYQNGVTNTLLHTGNLLTELKKIDGTDSGLDADTLDGLNSLSFIRNYGIVSTEDTKCDADNVDGNIVQHDYRWSNAPIDSIGSLLDLSYSADWRMQIFTHPRYNKIYVRSFYNGNTWTGWEELAKAASVTSLSETLSALNTKVGENTETLTAMQEDNAFNFSALAIRMSNAEGNITTLQGYFTNGIANKANLLKEAPVLRKDGDAIYLIAGGQQSTNFTVPYATSAGKLSDATAYTIFGQKFFEDGTPVSIANGASLSNLGSLSPYSGTTYNLGSSSAKWKTLYVQSISGLASLSMSGSLSAGSLSVSGISTFTGKTTHNGGLSATSGIFSTTLGVSGAASFASTINVMDKATFSKAVQVGITEANAIEFGTTGFKIWYDDQNNCIRTNANFAADGEVSSGGIGQDEEEVGYLSLNGGDIGSPTNQGKTLGLYGNLQFWYSSNPLNGVKVFMDAKDGLAIYSSNASGIAAAATSKYANLRVFGNIHALTNSYGGGYITCTQLTQGSDIRYKNVIEDILLPTSVIANAPIFRFTWTDRGDGRIFIGTSAQYWVEYAQELTQIVDERFSLDYATLGVLMGKSNATEIERLKKRIADLEAQIDNLIYRKNMEQI